jgi:hypothetical protein
MQRFLAALLLGALWACTGSLSLQDGDGPGEDAPVGDPGRVTVHRLNNSEYNNTVRDLLGTTLRPADDFPADDYSHGFDNISDVLSMSPVQVELYRRAAVSLAGAVMLDPGRILPCEPDPAAPRPCVTEFVTSFGKRAWRRPLTEPEIAAPLGLFDLAVGAGADTREGIRLVIEYMLSSPHFLFRFEIDPDPTSTEPRALGGYELASRLSYFLWSSMPDDELFAAAEAGSLRDRGEVRAQVDRMLADPKAAAFVDNFAGQWLFLRGLPGHDPDSELFPEFDGALRDAMIEETRQFFREFLESGRPVQQMLTADWSFLDERLAAHYGVEHTGPGFQRVSMAGSRRSGMLGHASILTVTSLPDRTSPVKRGLWVLEQLLCSAPPPPPPGVEGLPEGAGATGSIRDQLEAHREDPACIGCHVSMDNIGFALEHYDPVGTWRDMAGGYPIDATGELPGGARFDGAVEMAPIIADDSRFTLCLTEKMMTYALGRGLESHDHDTLSRIQNELRAGGSSLAELIALVATSDPVRFRRGEPEESR